MDHLKINQMFPQITLKGPEEEEVSEACKIPQFLEESGS